MDARSAATAKRIIENLQHKFWLEPTASKRAQDRKPWSVHLYLAITEPGGATAPRKTETKVQTAPVQKRTPVSRTPTKGDEVQAGNAIAAAAPGIIETLSGGGGGSGE